MTTDRILKERERGSAFLTVTILALASIALVGAFLSTSLAKVKHVEKHVAVSAAFNAADSAMAILTQEVWRIYKSAPAASRVAALAPLDGDADPLTALQINGMTVAGSIGSATVAEVRVVGSQYADVVIVGTGNNIYAERSARSIVRYGRKPSEVFNHAYFINNFGWLWGSSITVNGSVRSNGNFSMSSATVNGDIYASENPELGTVGTVTGTSYFDTVSDYNASESTHARPTAPANTPEDTNGNGVLDAGEDTNANGRLDDYDYDGGYDGTSDRLEAQTPVEMPYLGDLSTYRDLAISKGGTLSQGGSVLVNGVLGDEVGEAKNLIIVGTAANPIVINGPVVIEADVVLKGVVRGRGTIYAGRNVHIVGNLEYETPPSWDKPLSDMEATKLANLGADALGLAAKGSVVLGDYTQSYWSSTSSYLQPPFTKPYVVDPTDAANGYVTGTNVDGDPVFDGDYTAFDGGLRNDDSGVGTTARKFYESSFNQDEIRAVADVSQLTRIDAILYTNHALTGKIGACTINGSLVSRDEAIIYSGSIHMNHDSRIREDGYEYLDIFLPREPTYRVLVWSEGK